jgi:hypothetical protein
MQLIPAQHQHIDVLVLADRPPDGEFDRIPAGDPPRAGHRREDRGGLLRPHRIPGPERGHDDGHQAA